jgi:hypothetical protein
MYFYLQQTENEDETVEDSKANVKKPVATPKKSQTATTAHMCNYCNYTSPKR